MRYAVARFNTYQRDTVYRIFITDTVQMLTQAVAQIGGGTYQSQRFYDLVYKKEPEKTGGQILEEFIKNSGIEVIV